MRISKYFFVLFLIFFVECRLVHATHFGGQLNIGVNGKLDKINPFFTSSTYGSTLLDFIYDPLIHLSHDGEMLPSIASKWLVSEDRKIWTFTLKENVYFHDGEKLSTKDVVFTFSTFGKLEDIIFRSASNNIEKIEVKNDMEITFTLKKADQVFPIFLSRVYIAPQHLFLDDGSPRDLKYYDQPIGSGPFKAITVGNDGALLAANNQYYRGKPFLEKINFIVFDNERNLLAALMNGTIDIQLFFNLKYNNVIANIPDLQVSDYPADFLLALFLNNNNTLFKHSKVRQALNYAINKNFIFDRSGISNDQGNIAASVVPPSSNYFDNSLLPYRYDPEYALKLLAQEGWSMDETTHILKQNGQVFTFTVLLPEGWNIAEKSLQMIRDDLIKIGISIKVEKLPFDIFIGRVFASKNYDAAIFHYVNTLGIYMDDLFWKSIDKANYNFTSYANKDIGHLLDEIRYMVDPLEFKIAYKTFQSLIHDDPPMIFLFWNQFPIVTNKRVKGMQLSPYSFTEDILQVWIDE